MISPTCEHSNAPCGSKSLASHPWRRLTRGEHERRPCRGSCPFLASSSSGPSRSFHWLETSLHAFDTGHSAWLGLRGSVARGRRCGSCNAQRGARGHPQADRADAVEARGTPSAASRCEGETRRWPSWRKAPNAIKPPGWDRCSGSVSAFGQAACGGPQRLYLLLSRAG